MGGYPDDYVAPSQRGEVPEGLTVPSHGRPGHGLVVAHEREPNPAAQDVVHHNVSCWKALSPEACRRRVHVLLIWLAKPNRRQLYILSFGELRRSARVGAQWYRS